MASVHDNGLSRDEVRCVGAEIGDRLRGPVHFAETLERVCIETVESGKMTKDLALLIGPDQEYQTTQEFLASIDENLQRAMA